MSRNRKRSIIPQQNIPDPIPTPPTQILETQKDTNPFGLSFVVPTEVIRLPSSGVFYGETSSLFGITEVEVRAVTAAEEDIMINDNFISNGVVFEKLIESILITPGIKVQDMLDCDKIAILMSARRTGYGDIVNFTSNCSSCSAENELEISLTELIERNNNNTYSPKDSEQWKYDKASQTFSFKLPVSGLDVAIRLLGKEDLNMLEASKDQKQKLNLSFNETIEFIRSVLVSAQGITDRSSINQLAEVLPAADARRIRLVHNKNLPQVDTMQEYTCKSCGAQNQEEVPFSLGWFWSE